MTLAWKSFSRLHDRSAGVKPPPSSRPRAPCRWRSRGRRHPSRRGRRQGASPAPKRRGRCQLPDGLEWSSGPWGRWPSTNCRTCTLMGFRGPPGVDHLWFPASRRRRMVPGSRGEKPGTLLSQNHNTPTGGTGEDGSHFGDCQAKRKRPPGLFRLEPRGHSRIPRPAKQAAAGRAVKQRDRHTAKAHTGWPFCGGRIVCTPQLSRPRRTPIRTEGKTDRAHLPALVVQYVPAIKRPGGAGAPGPGTGYSAGAAGRSGEAGRIGRRAGPRPTVGAGDPCIWPGGFFVLA